MANRSEAMKKYWNSAKGRARKAAMKGKNPFKKKSKKGSSGKSTPTKNKRNGNGGGLIGTLNKLFHLADDGVKIITAISPVATIAKQTILRPAGSVQQNAQDFSRQLLRAYSGYDYNDGSFDITRASAGFGPAVAAGGYHINSNFINKFAPLRKNMSLGSLTTSLLARGMKYIPIYDAYKTSGGDIARFGEQMTQMYTGIGTNLETVSYNGFNAREMLRGYGPTGAGYLVKKGPGWVMKKANSFKLKGVF